MNTTKPLVVINVVGLTHGMLGRDTPHISALAAEGFARPLLTVFPAVTCSVQTSLLTGSLPREHGIVGNGWYDRELAEVFFWRQSNRLVHGERLYMYVHTHMYIYIYIYMCGGWSAPLPSWYGPSPF